LADNQCFNKWDGWNFALALKQEKQYRLGLEVCRNVYTRFAHFNAINNVYAWCIYYMEIATASPANEARYFKAAEAITRLTQQSDRYSAYTLTVLKVLHYIEPQLSDNTERVFYWLNKLDPDLLDDKPFVLTLENGKKVEMAPAVEYWHVLKAKVLLANKQYEDCLAHCQTTLGKITKFHYGNEVWLQRIQVQALAGTGKIVDAIALQDKLLKLKRDWFLQKELADLYVKNKQPAEALVSAVQAALRPGEISRKINLYQLIVTLSQEADLSADALVHLQLIYQIRMEQQWPLPARLLQQLAENKVSVTSIPSISQLLAQAKAIWLRLSIPGLKQYSGMVKTILPNGRSGFVEVAGKSSYYFVFTDAQIPFQQIKPGLKVKFCLAEGFDKKKNRKVENAVNLVVE
jgi:tetratricopeptide (TPR) repeat protein